VGHLREDLPALAQQLSDVSAHLFHVEVRLPVVGSLPASLVGEGFAASENSLSTCRETGPPVSVYGAASTVVPRVLKNSLEAIPATMRGERRS